MTPRRSFPVVTTATIAGILLVATALSPFIAQAIWTEPSGTAPTGNIAAPISTGNNAQTKSGNLFVSGGVSAQTGLPSNAGGIVGTLQGVGGTAAAGGTAVGVRGEASVTASAGGLQPGVYGGAGTNQSASIGVYGSNGGFANAWASRFTGKVGAESRTTVFGLLQVAGWGQFGSTSFDPFADLGGLTQVLGVSTTAGAGAVGIRAALASPATSGDAVSGAYTGSACLLGFEGSCVGVVGLDAASVPSITKSVRAAGHFLPSLNIDGVLSDSNGPYPRTYADSNGPVFRRPAHTANTTAGPNVAGAFDVGSSVSKTLVVDGSGLWVGARKRIRLSDGAVLVDAAGPTDGALVYDGKHLWQADRSANTLRRINTGTGLDFQTLPLPAGWSFPPGDSLYFDGTTVWGLTCNNGSPSRLTLAEFGRFNAVTGAEEITNPWGSPATRTLEVDSLLVCGYQVSIQGVRAFGKQYLKIGPTVILGENINTFEYSATTLQRAISNQYGAPSFILGHFYDHAGPGWLVDGDMMFISGTQNGNPVLGRFTPVGNRSVFGFSPFTPYPHADFLATDGKSLWGVDRSVSPAVLHVFTDPNTVDLTLPAGGKGQIVYDGSYFWVAGTDGDTNVYKIQP